MKVRRAISFRWHLKTLERKAVNDLGLVRPVEERAYLLEDTAHVVLSARLDIASLGVVLKNPLILLDILVLNVIVDTVEDTLVHSDNVLHMFYNIHKMQDSSGFPVILPNPNRITQMRLTQKVSFCFFLGG